KAAEEAAYYAEAERRLMAHWNQLEKNEKELKAEREKLKKALFDKYIGSSLRSGSTPYANCFGKNTACSDTGCARIVVNASPSSDLIAILKKEDKVFQHAYVKRDSSYTFEIPNGTYQAFFYSGIGW